MYASKRLKTQQGSTNNNEANGGKKGRGKKGKKDKKGGKRGNGKNPDEPHPFAFKIPGKTNNEETQNTIETARLHLKCKSLNSLTAPKAYELILDNIVKSTGSENSDAEKNFKKSAVELFKNPTWGYCFLSITEDSKKTIKNMLIADIRNLDDEILEVADAAQRKERKENEDQKDTVEKNRFGFAKGTVPTLFDIKMRLKSWASKKGDVTLTDKTCPLYSEFDYKTQLDMKHTYAKTTSRNFVKKMRQVCEKEGFDVPEWCDVKRANHGCMIERIVPSDESILKGGYRNKVEFSIGVNHETENIYDRKEAKLDEPCSFNKGSDLEKKTSNLRNPETTDQLEVGFIKCMLPSNEQVVGSPAEVPHIQESMKRIAKIMKDVVIESKLPVYRRNRAMRDGFWRLVLCRAVDTVEEDGGDDDDTNSKKKSGEKSAKTAQTKLESDPSKHRILLMVSTTTISDPIVLKYVRDLLIKHFIVKNKNLVNVESIAIQFNDSLSDAICADSTKIEFRDDLQVKNLKEHMNSSSFAKSTSIPEFVESSKKPNFSLAHKTKTVMHHFYGLKILLMPLCGLKFEVGPLSFFQVNSLMTERLYGKAFDWATETDGEESQNGNNAGKNTLLLDVCSGVGTIGCIAASRKKRDSSGENNGSKNNNSFHVIGVELVAEAVESANRNAEITRFFIIRLVVFHFLVHFKVFFDFF